MTHPITRDKTPADPRSGEPDVPSRGPDVWPFKVPVERPERLPVHEDRARAEERPARGD